MKQFELNIEQPAKLLGQAAILASSVFFAAPVAANDLPITHIQKVQFVEDVGAGARINLSGKLRMLSQRIPAAACYFEEGIKTDDTGAMLGAASAEFSQIVSALEFGDDNLGVFGAEPRRKTLMAIEKLHELWDPMLEIVESIQSGGGSREEITAVADASAPVLEAAKLLVSEISGEYSNPTAILQTDALTIDIAGRQRMLSQRMSKNICLITAEVNVEAATAELAATAEMFETSLNALTFGMEAAGIRPPKTSEIVAGLEIVAKDWAIIKPIVTAVLEGDVIDDETRGLAFSAANQMTADMNAVVGLYSEASKTGL